MLKVAIVEDEELVRQGLALAVDWSRMGCLLVGTAADGQEGVALVRATQPDFVLTDVRMPRMDGLTMVHTLRAEGCTAEFIILTAYSDFAYAHRALRLGVTDYLLKPFQDEELEAAVEKIRVRLSERAAATVGEGAGVMRFDLEKGSKSKYIEEAIGYLREHYGEELTLAQLAEATNLSEGYLSRLFKKKRATPLTVTSRFTASTPRCAFCRTATKRCMRYRRRSALRIRPTSARCSKSMWD